METITLEQNMIIEYISQSMGDFISDDIMVTINSDSDDQMSPIIYSLINVWQEGQVLNYNIREWYIVENKITKVIKIISQDYLCEFIRLLVSEELYNLCVWTDISEKVSPYITLAYLTLSDMNIIQPLVEKLDRILDEPEKYRQELRNKYNIEIV
jgi:hypothetical protein